MNSQRMILALTWLVEHYKDDVRKSSGAPGIHHPLGVCELVMAAGGDEDTYIAALFHDFAEDKGGEEMLSKIRAEFGDRVAQIVRDCSDTIPSAYTEKEPWAQRKVNHISHICDLSDESRLVLAADSLHNVRDHIQGFRANGMNWWKNFRANVYEDKPVTPYICVASTLWYIEEKLFALQSAGTNNWENPVLIELRMAYQTLFTMCISDKYILNELHSVKTHMSKETL